MSFTDPTADVAQPEGQGDGSTSDAPYAEYLNRVPEEVRGDIEPVFKDWDANVTRRFQEASEYRKQWEPYEQAGVTQYRPEDIQAAFQLLQDPEQARAWLDQNYGPIQAAVETPQAEPAVDDYSAFGVDPQQFERLLESKLTPLQQQVEQWQQRWTEFEQQAHEAQIAGQIEQAVAELKAKEADRLPAELRDKFDGLIEQFGMQYAEQGADPQQVVQRAWADLQVVLNAAQKSAFQSAADAPKPAEAGGVPDVSTPQAKRIQDVQAMAEEFLRNNNRA